MATSADGATWTTSTVVGNGDTGHYPSIAVAPNGDVGISFVHGNDTSLRAVFGP